MLFFNELKKKLENLFINITNSLSLLELSKIYFKLESIKDVSSRKKISSEVARQKYLKQTRILKLKISRPVFHFYVLNYASKKWCSFSKRYASSKNIELFFLFGLVESKAIIYNTNFIILKKYFDYRISQKRNMNYILDEPWMTKQFGIKIGDKRFRNIRQYLIFLVKDSSQSTIFLSSFLIKDLNYYFGKNSVRSLSSSMERWPEFLKINKKKFMIFENWMKIYWKNEEANISRLLIKESPIKFKELKKYILNRKEKQIFIGDSFYYLLKRFSRFYFDSGNRKIISMKSIISLDSYLAQKFPKGFGNIFLEELKKVGYSESICVNRSDLFSNFYFSKNSFRKIKFHINNWIQNQTEYLIHKKIFKDELKGSLEDLDFLLNVTPYFFTIIKNHTNLEISSDRDNVIIKKNKQKIDLKW